MTLELKLFDDFERTDTDSDNFKVVHYHFLNNSAVPEAERARKKIEEWSDGFLLKPEFLNKFRSKNNKQHTAALFELFIFHYFKKRGYLIKNIDVAGTPTPDFIIEAENGPIYIECTCSSNSNIEESIDTMQAVILDSLKKLDKQNNFVNIEWLAHSYVTPSERKIRFLIKQYINEVARPPYLQIEESGWIIRITIIPGRSEIKRGIGVIKYPAAIVTPHLNVLTALKDKRPSRYNIAGPYIIALYSEDMHLDYLDMDLALFNGASFQDKLPINRVKDQSFFIGQTGLINTSVSGVLLVQRLPVYGDGEARMMLWHHPEPKYPLSPNDFTMHQKTYQRQDEKTFKITDLLEKDPNR